VGVAGLVQSGGFGSFSKRFGTAASSLLEAEVVTADGKIRTVNASQDPDLLWALKGGGGGTFGVVTRMKLALHELPDYAGACIARINASSDSAYRELIERFMTFYHQSLFNEHWGETVDFSRHNHISINMVASGLSTEEIARTWKPFFDDIKASPSKFEIQGDVFAAAIPAEHWWDRAFWEKNFKSAITLDPRPGHGNDWWWAGDGGQVGWYIYGYESLWLPESLLTDSDRSQLIDAMFAATRRYGFALHFNKGLAGAPADVIASAKNTATNPNVTTSFALAISADGDQGIYPGIQGHEPDTSAARTAARNVHACLDELRRVAPAGGSYVSESNYFEPSFGTSYWGTNCSRLVAVKKRYDQHNLFAVRNGVTVA
jgi:FAD/FMN-containing dehydrogenase